ncbi:universal stress protein UspA [Streptomyces sp. WAC 06738]|uniref:universal stress protein n=1 Tax=Streptomyces sp. WAC 06738 TaxID=2203210 RepID=UPI000F6BB134|nr:universal stress protein [Streptomyces sp. WAC 06738]AZM49960.1 universal stress protein UspA [Streptomyces sp. WAC 06738]
MVSAPVLVGVDGSAEGLAAVAVAAREARLRGTALRVVHAFFWPMMRVPLEPSSMGPPEGGLRNQAEQVVAEAVRHAREAEPDVEAEGAVVTGDTLPVMAEESRGAALAVVGSRGLGAFAGLLLGSTAVHLAAHGHCPVLVVRGEGGPAREGPVVAGVDGSRSGDAAIEFAFAEASMRGTGLVAVHAWSPWRAEAPRPQDPAAPYASGPGDLAVNEERVLAESLAGRQERCPDVSVDRRVLRGGPREALIEASREASLVVVGARGRGGFTGMLLGSVSQALLHHADCPVAVVRPEPDTR